MSPPPMLPRVRKTFRAVTVACVPACRELDEAGWTRAEAIVEHALAGRPPAVRRQLALFLRILEALPLLRHGRRLSSLPDARARAFLASLERAPLLPVRRGVWGIRTLTFMGYYGQRAVGGELGYRAGGAGWEARGGSAGEWTERGAAGEPEPVVVDVLERAGHGA